MADVEAMQIKTEVKSDATPVSTKPADNIDFDFVTEPVVIKLETVTEPEPAAGKTAVAMEMDVDEQPESTEVEVKEPADSKGNGEVNGLTSLNEEVETQMESNDNNEKEDCSCGEDILIAENKRLSSALFQLHERQSLLEDFIEVEYGKEFDRFMENRDRLVKMGFGAKDSSSTMETSGVKTFQKSKELVDLLKMIKDQAKVSNSNSGSGKQNQSRNNTSTSTASSQGSRSAPYKVPGPVTKAPAPAAQKTDPAVLKEYLELKDKLVCPECKQITKKQEMKDHLRGHLTANSEVECAMCDKKLNMCQERITSHLTNYHHLAKERSTSIASQMSKEWDTKHKVKIDALNSQVRNATKAEFDEYKKQKDSEKKSEVENVKNGSNTIPEPVKSEAK